MDRFVARSFKDGKRTLWGVYDTVRYSWPIQIPGVPRRIEQDFHSEKLAQMEADWLNSLNLNWGLAEKTKPIMK
jgi:hypothetical protein